MTLSWWCTLIALTLSSIGTMGMWYGRLDAFIKVKTSSGGHRMMMFGNKSIKIVGEEGSFEFSPPPDAKKRQLANSWGIRFLMLGFMIQLIALLLDP